MENIGDQQQQMTDTVATGFAQPRQQLDCRLNAGDRYECRSCGPYLREQLESRSGDDAESSLGTQEQRLDVVAGVVFPKCTQR